MAATQREPDHKLQLQALMMTAKQYWKKIQELEAENKQLKQELEQALSQLGDYRDRS